MRQVHTEQVSQPSGHFSQAIQVPAQGRLVFLSGMTARRPDGSVVGIGDIAAQTRQVCENLQHTLAAAGGSMADLVRVDVFVRNIEHFDKIHAVRREFFATPPPASTMVEVAKLVSPEMLIEINAIAVVADDS